MAILFTRTLLPIPGKLGDSQNFVRERMDAIRSLYGVDVELIFRIGGPIGQLRMQSWHPDMADLEAHRSQIFTDTGAGKLPTPEPGLFVPGESYDAIWKKA